MGFSPYDGDLLLRHFILEGRDHLRVNLNTRLAIKLRKTVRLCSKRVVAPLYAWWNARGDK